MKIPKYIDHAIKMRTKYAIMLSDCCDKVDKWLDSHGIDGVEVTDFDECAFGNVEIYCNPVSAEKDLRNQIKKL